MKNACSNTQVEPIYLITKILICSQEDKFDVIVVSYFLHRPTFQALLDSLNPNGMLFYQTLIKVIF